MIGYDENEIDLSESNRIERSGDGVYGVAKDDDGTLTLLIDIEKSLDRSEFKVLKDKMVA